MPGRPVRFNGITISRFENGLILEDWSVTDTLEMLRQLGLTRSVLLGIKALRSPPGGERTKTERPGLQD